MSTIDQHPDEQLPTLKKSPVLTWTLTSIALGATVGVGTSFLLHKIFPNRYKVLWKAIINGAADVGVIAGFAGYSRAEASNRKIDEVAPHIVRLKAERDEARNKLTQVESALHPESGGVER